MRNMDSNSSLERMKQLINHGSQDAALKPNISETVEYKVNGPNGNVYGIVREKQRYFIKESKDGVSFDYIGGIGNKSENEYPSYNSAYRNLELKIREMNASKNTGKVFETFKPATQAEYIIEATEDMRKELDRFKQITNGAQNIMKESTTEFINKPTFKDPESFGKATDPKKQGAPFTDAATAKLDKDPNFKATDPKKQGDPFDKEAKSDEEKFDIEKTNAKPVKAGDPFTAPAKDVLGNSVATQNPKGGKVFKVTEAQLTQLKKYMTEDFGDEEFYYNDEDESDLLKQFNYDINNLSGGKKFTPSKKDLIDINIDDDDDDEKYSELNPGFHINDDGLDDIDIDVNDDGLDDDVNIDVNDDGVDIDVDNELEQSEDDIEEGLWDTLKGVGSVGKHFGGQAAQGIKQGAKDAYGNVKQGFKNAGKAASQIYNQSKAASSQSAIDKIASDLAIELKNLNNRTIKGGGQPLNYNSIITSLANKMKGQVRKESVEPEMDENLVKEITEAVLNAFGQHPTYQKAAFTTPAADADLKPGTHEWDDASVKGQAPYGQKIGSSAPFTEPVKQKVGEGEIGEDADEIMQGKTPQGLPNLGQKGDKAPFNKTVQKNGDKIAKGTPVQQGEKPQGKAELGKKGNKAPFDKAPTKKAEVLNKLAESIIADLKKKS
jgi:hypothetical protein